MKLLILLVALIICGNSVGQGLVSYKLSPLGEPIVFEDCVLAWGYFSDDWFATESSSVYCSTAPANPITSNPYTRVMYVNDVPIKCHLRSFYIIEGGAFDVQMECFEYDKIFNDGFDGGSNGN